jgi:ribosomal protein L14E/L6E/L27E
MGIEQEVEQPIVDGVNTATSSTADHSTEVQDTQADVNQQSQTDATATSTEANDTDVKPKNVFEAVKQGLAQSAADKEAGATSSTEAQGKTEAKTETTEQEAEPDSDDDLIKSLEDKDPKSRAATRIRELVSLNKEYEADALSFRELSNFTAESGLDQDEFLTGLQIMRDMKKDPFKAFEALMPYVEALQMQVGEVLPDDIQQRLDAGLIDEETAKELAQARSKSTFMTEQQQLTQEQQQQQFQEQQTQEFVRQVATAVTTYEKSWQQSDPDYAKKKGLTSAFVDSIMAKDGYPKTPQQAVEQVKKARGMAEAQLREIAPPKKTVQPVVNQQSTSVQPQFKSSLDAARAALNT